jgi:hypothetical protein
MFEGELTGLRADMNEIVRLHCEEAFVDIIRSRNGRQQIGTEISTDHRRCLQQTTVGSRKSVYACGQE